MRASRGGRLMLDLSVCGRSPAGALKVPFGHQARHARASTLDGSSRAHTPRSRDATNRALPAVSRSRHATVRSRHRAPQDSPSPDLAPTAIGVSADATAQSPNATRLPHDAGPRARPGYRPAPNAAHSPRLAPRPSPAASRSGHPRSHPHPPRRSYFFSSPPSSFFFRPALRYRIFMLYSAALLGSSSLTISPALLICLSAT